MTGSERPGPSQTRLATDSAASEASDIDKAAAEIQGILQSLTWEWIEKLPSLFADKESGKRAAGSRAASPTHSPPSVSAAESDDDDVLVVDLALSEMARRTFNILRETDSILRRALDRKSGTRINRSSQ